MGRLEQNNQLLESLNREFDSLMVEMSNRVSEVTGNYTDLQDKAKTVLARAGNMNTLGDLEAANKIMDFYNNAIKVVEQELNRMKEQKEQEEYTDEDIKGYEDLKKIAQDVKKNSKIGKELEAIEEFEKRQPIEKEIFSQKAAREVQEKIEREENAIKTLSRPINQVMEELEKDGLYDKYNQMLADDEAIAGYTTQLKKFEKQKADFSTTSAKIEKQLQEEGKTPEEIAAILEAEKRNLDDLIAQIQQDTIEQVKRVDPNCAKIQPGKDESKGDFYTRIMTAHDVSRIDILDKIDAVFEKMKGETINIIGADGKVTTNTLDGVMSGITNVQEKVSRLLEEKGKLANHTFEKEEKVAKLKKQEEAYRKSVEEEEKDEEVNNKLMPTKLSYKDKKDILMQCGYGKFMASVRGFFSRTKTVQKKLEGKIKNDRAAEQAAKQEAKKADKANYYADFHKEFTQSLKKGIDVQEAQKRASGKLHEQRYSQFKDTYTLRDEEDKDNDGR